mgnify:CR=1 FL=1
MKFHGAMMLCALLTAVFWVSLCSSSWANDGLCCDIRVDAAGDSLILKNTRLSCVFDRRSGEWRSLNLPQIGAVLGRPSPAFAALFDDGETTDMTFNGYEYAVDAAAQRVDLVLQYHADNDSLTLTSAYSLFATSARLERRITVTNRSGKTRKLLGFRLDLPDVALGNPADCRLDAPGPWFPTTYIGPQKPYNELLNRPITFHSAPEAGFGLLVLSNPSKNSALSAWMETGGEVNYNPSIRGDRRLTLAFTNHRAYRLLPNMSASSDPLVIEFTKGDFSQALAPYRRMVCETFPLGHSPEWVREAVILEAYPDYYPDGFRGITARLPFYREIGINCLYLMPHWLGGYSPIDQFKVDPRYGSEKDLQELVKTAHNLGMKVLFDMVIHGMNEKSPLTQERPELFCKDEQGQIVRHPVWRSMTFDWANPLYQAYMVELVQHDLQTYDIDGYRVDAASYKGPNWDPTVPYPAYRSGSMAPQLMTAMLEALRSTKPDAVLLSEVFGPVFQTVCNFVHDNQTEAAQMIIEKIDAGEATAETYKAHLANVFAMLPPGANRVIYTRNHDTSWFYHFHGYTPRFMAFEALHALCAIPEIFSGDPKNGPNPEDDPQTWEYYRRLFALRAKHETLTKGEPQFRQISGDNPMIFSAIKALNDRCTAVVISLSEHRERVRLQIDPSLGALQGENRLTGLNGETVVMRDGQVTLEPFAVYIFEIHATQK